MLPSIGGPSSLSRPRPGDDAVGVTSPSVPSTESCVTLLGEVTRPEVEQYEDAVSAALAGQGEVVIDVSNVTFMDSAGVQLLLRALTEATHQSRRVVLVGANHGLRRLLVATGIESLFTYR